MTLDMEKMRALSLQGLRDCIAEGRMTQELWNKLRPETREAVRDNSGLTAELTGHEGWRVRIVTADGATFNRIIGKTTGWKPAHLLLRQRNQNASSWLGDDLGKIVKVTRLERVR